MRHAFLIIAHNEPEILQMLISALDDARNDIYVHIDKKADFSGMNLYASKSKLVVLPVRLDVRWGDYSMVEAEYLLFESAFCNGCYGYYHLLSGVDLPIKSQDFIHEFCDLHCGKEFIGFAQNASQRELDWRSQHYFVYSKDFQTVNVIKKIIRALFARLQSAVHYRRSSLVIKKGAQWCSVTGEFVEYLIKNKGLVRKMFNHTYCPDEMFIQTLCWNSEFKDRLYNTVDEFEGCKRYIKWIDGVLSPLSIDDVEKMRLSGRWFARKFSIADTLMVKTVLRSIG